MRGFFFFFSLVLSLLPIIDSDPTTATRIYLRPLFLYLTRRMHRFSSALRPLLRVSAACPVSLPSPSTLLGAPSLSCLDIRYALCCSQKALLGF